MIFSRGQRTHVVFVLSLIEIHGELLLNATIKSEVLIFVGVIVFIFDYYIGLIHILKIGNFLDQVLI